MREQKTFDILEQETVVYQGLCLHYQLGQITSGGNYFLSVTHKQETAQVFLGNDLHFARECYRLVRDGGVTPCALAEVVSDLRLDKAFFEKPIYKSPKK